MKLDNLDQEYLLQLENWAREQASLLDEAISLLADWCDAIRDGGAGWDDWDKYYKAAAYKDGPLRALIDAKRKRELDPGQRGGMER